ncbi:MAG: 3-deoxy-manno-octulosonate cytidylyltransferase, partial [Nitrospira sp. SB0678_bin_10]|nr:3-deoxy-manno-octulosonate cytidylyltransferase [Nitrospira sp. SB0678_bin_10]
NVVTAHQGKALYFSRAPIPHARDHVRDNPPFASLHLGVYIFRRRTLNRFASLPSGELEETEKLEQLRALEHGIPIHVWETNHASLRIDTQEDLERANASWDELMAGQVHD